MEENCTLWHCILELNQAFFPKYVCRGCSLHVFAEFLLGGRQLRCSEIYQRPYKSVWWRWTTHSVHRLISKSFQILSLWGWIWKFDCLFPSIHMVASMCISPYTLPSSLTLAFFHHNIFIILWSKQNNTTMNASANAAPPIVPTYNMLDLKHIEDNEIALELYEIVEAVQAHILVPNQDTVRLL